MILLVIVGLVAAAVGGWAGYVMRQRMKVDPVQAADVASAQLRAEAETRAKEILLQAQDEAVRLRTSAEEEHRGRRVEIQRQEKRLQQKEEQFDRKQEELEQRERGFQAREREIDAKERQADELRLAQTRELEQLSGLTTDEARDVIVAQIEQDVRDACVRRTRELELEAAEQAEPWARRIIATAIQRYSSDQVSESTVSVVHIPNEEMKGRIIGREGRNIRALEAATGVDLIVDDTPDAVTLSGFDPVRREIARLALTKLVTDGRIHPARIEEIVGKAKQEVEAHIRQEGETAAYEAGVHGLHPEIVKMMGKMRFRTSYGQNQLQHSIEVAHLAAMMAAEVGADVAQTRRSSFLHDIGKVMTSDVEGPHHYIGADFVSRFGEGTEVCDAIRGHHDHDPEYQTVEAVLLQAADAISGARPGARRESVEHYVKRLEALESVANSFEGVEKSFAIQAGREVRIIVRPDEIDDHGAVRLARDIVKRIEETLQYPGQVKVTVVRETRAVDFAR
ncbi:MAG: ribonuclease Y [Chloroflexi bacterium]|nr:ribonuclease Y [Chloroflexota bacterium]